VRFLFVLSILLLTLPAFAATHEVPNDLNPNIQGGINVAKPGDTVRVAPGTYTEAINFSGKDITLTSHDPMDPAVVGATIINGRGANIAVTLQGTETKAAVLTGFTIFGADRAAIATMPGADRLSEATIRYNIIRDNGRAHKVGYGIADTNGLIEYNQIFSNAGTDSGNGVYRCHGTIRYNDIHHNSGALTGNGARLCRGLILYNRIYDHGGGSGRGVTDCDGTIRGNFIFRNSGAKYGYGIRDSDGVIENNFIYANNGSRNGYGVASCKGKILHNTICANSHYGIQSSPAKSIKNNILWGNRYQITGESTLPQYCCIQDWDAGGIGNMAHYPKFIDPQAANFHLAPDSPCIDRAIATAITTDIDAQKRPEDGDADGEAKSDIGADEVAPPQ
jgi:hypothetical protein